MQKKYAVVSLFCGAGGLDMGFENVGFDILWSNDFNKDACKLAEVIAAYVKDILDNQ